MLEELTWAEVRDLIKAGKTTALRLVLGLLGFGPGRHLVGERIEQTALIGAEQRTGLVAVEANADQFVPDGDTGT